MDKYCHKLDSSGETVAFPFSSYLQLSMEQVRVLYSSACLLPRTVVLAYRCVCVCVCVCVCAYVRARLLARKVKSFGGIFNEAV